MNDHPAMLVSRRKLRCFAGGALALGWCATPSEARAADFEVTGETALQAYEVSDPWGDVVLERRRFTQTIGLGVYNLQGAYEPGKADYRIVVRLRVDADFGINGNLSAADGGGETNWRTAGGNEGTRYIPGLAEAPVDLMYGYIEGRNLAGGLLGFRLGRQYMTDVLGWWAFDGGLVRLTTPYFVQAEVYAGFEERGGLPLSSSRFEQQGVWRGSHTDFGGDNQPSAADYPSYQFAEPAPAFGFALESNGPSWIHGRFTYRRVYNSGESITQQFPDPAANSASTGGYKTIDGLRISSDRLGYALDLNKSDLGGAKGGIAYDLYTQNVTRWYAGLEGYAGKRVTLGADFEYFYPTFDADSIWNWFTHSPINTLTGRASIQFTRRFDLALSGGVRQWQEDGNPATFAAGQCAAAGQQANCRAAGFNFDPSNPAFGNYARQEQNRGLMTTNDALGNLAGRYKWGSGRAGFRGMLEAGNRGHRVGGDLDGEQKIDDGRWTVGARTSLYDWADELRPDRNATSFGYVLAGGFRPAQVADFRVEWEHDMNRLIGQRYRVVGLINLKVLQ